MSSFYFNFNCPHNYLDSASRKQCFCFDNWMKKVYCEAILEENYDMMLKLARFSVIPVWDYLMYACTSHKFDVFKFLLLQAYNTLPYLEYLSLLENTLITTIEKKAEDYCELLIANGTNNFRELYHICKDANIKKILEKYL